MRSRGCEWCEYLTIFGERIPSRPLIFALQFFSSWVYALDPRAGPVGGSRTQLGSHELIDQEHTRSVRYDPEQMSGQTAIQCAYTLLHPNKLQRL